MRSSIINKINGYNEKYYYAQDYELWTRLIHISKTYIMPDLLTYHRILDQSISIKNIKAQRYNALVIKFKSFNKYSFSVGFIKMIMKDLFIILLPMSFINYLRGK